MSKKKQSKESLINPIIEVGEACGSAGLRPDEEPGEEDSLPNRSDEGATSDAADQANEEAERKIRKLDMIDWGRRVHNAHRVDRGVTEVMQQAVKTLSTISDGHPTSSLVVCRVIERLQKDFNILHQEMEAKLKE